MYSLEIEQPKTVKGLSSMRFTTQQWKEIAVGERDELIEYAKQRGFDRHNIKWRVSGRPQMEADK